MRCPDCATPVRRGDKYCGKCGRRLGRTGTLTRVLLPVSVAAVLVILAILVWSFRGAVTPESPISPEAHTSPTTPPEPPVLAANNLAPNPSFEEGGDAPTGWRLLSSGKLFETTLDTNVVSSGARSVRSTIGPDWPGIATQGATGGGVESSAPISIDANRTYKLSVRVKASPDVALYISVSGAPHYFVPPNNQWSEYSFTVGPLGSGALLVWPPGIEKVTITLRWATGGRVSSGDGTTLSLPNPTRPTTIWFDDVYFGEISINMPPDHLNMTSCLSTCHQKDKPGRVLPGSHASFADSPQFCQSCHKPTAAVAPAPTITVAPNYAYKWDVTKNITFGSDRVQVLVAGDTRGDGQMRIVAGSTQQGMLYVVGYQNGSYVEEWSTKLGTSGIVPSAVGDADNDGHPELLIGQRQQTSVASDGKIYMYRWDGSTYKSVLIQDTMSSTYSMPAAIADLDGDGKNELITSPGRVTVYRYSSKSGKFEGLWAAPGGTNSLISTGDVDGDGRPEAVYALPAPQKGLVIVGYANGYKVETTLSDFSVKPVDAASAADLDNDGVAEIIAGASTQIFVVRHGSGGYSTQLIHSLLYGAATEIHSGDIDGDGIPEAEILPGTRGATLVKYSGSGYQVSDVPHTNTGSCGDVADVDGDGLAEVLANSMQGTVQVAGILTTGTPGAGGAKRIAYISGDAIFADSFKRLLETYGYPTDIIPKSSVLQTNFSRYALIIIGSNTGYDDKEAAAIQNARKPILGMQNGGAGLFKKMGLSISSGNGWTTTLSSLYVAEPAHPIFSLPYPINIPQNGEIVVIPEKGTSVMNNVYSLYTPALSPGVQLLAREFNDTSHYPLVREGSNILWGFWQMPDMLTDEGRSLFLNVVDYLSSLPAGG